MQVECNEDIKVTREWNIEKLQKRFWDNYKEQNITCLHIGGLITLRWLGIVATYPSTMVRKGQHKWAEVFVSKGENKRSRHQRLFQENVRKAKKDKGLCILKLRVRELFTHGKSISTPRVRHKGRQPLIKCSKSWHTYYLFSFFMFIIFFFFMFFFTFWGRQESLFVKLILCFLKDWF